MEICLQSTLSYLSNFQIVSLVRRCSFQKSEALFGFRNVVQIGHSEKCQRIFVDSSERDYT